MTYLHAEWEGNHRLARELEDLEQRRIPMAQGNLVRIAHDVAYRAAKQFAPVGLEGSRYQTGPKQWVYRSFRAPGGLVRGINSEYIDKIGPLVEASIASTQPYSNLVERGRKPIVARGRLLVFWTGGRYHRREAVRGVAPNPFMLKAADVTRSLIAQGNLFRL